MPNNALAKMLAAILLVPLLWVGPVQAQEYGTQEEAQAMAENAAALFHAEGADAAFTAFNGDADFVDRDLYVFAIGTDGDVVAHGSNPNLLGRNVLELRDPSGREFVREFIAVEDSAWVDYQWQNPETGAVEDKTSYVINLGDYVIGVGVYR